MARVWRVIAVAMAAVVGLSLWTTGAVFATSSALGPVSASAGQVAQMRGSVVYPVSRATVWAWTENPQWLCQLVPSCAGIEVTSAKGVESYQLLMNMNTPDLPGVQDLGIVPVAVTIDKRVVGRSLALQLKLDHALGSFVSDAVLRVASTGEGGSRITYTTVSADGTGVAGRLVIAQIIDSMQPQMNDSLAAYTADAELVPAQVFTLVTGRTTAKGTVVRGKFTEIAPLGLMSPPVTGTLRLYLGNNLVCTAKVSPAGQGVCRVKLQPRRGTPVLGILNAELEGGWPVSIGAVNRLRAGAAR
jgi:hypothetical protein